MASANASDSSATESRKEDEALQLNFPVEEGGPGMLVGTDVEEFDFLLQHNPGPSLPVNVPTLLQNVTVERAATSIIEGEDMGMVDGYEKGSVLQFVVFERLEQLEKLRSSYTDGTLDRKWEEDIFKQFKKPHILGSVKVTLDEALLKDIETFFTADTLPDKVKVAVIYCEKRKVWYWSPDQTYWQCIKAPVFTKGEYEGKRPNDKYLKIFSKLLTHQNEKGKCPICEEGLQHPPSEQSEAVLQRRIQIKVQWKEEDSDVVSTEIPCLLLRLKEEFQLAVYGQKKLSIQDVMKVADERTHHSKGIAIEMLRKLIMCDYTARDSLVPVKSPQFIESDKIVFETDMFDDLKGSPFHNPLDQFILAFVGCDDMLKALLFKAMFQCQLAVPLFIPELITSSKSECFTVAPLWNVSILTVGEKGLVTEFSIPSTPCNSVGFIRLGTHKMSKSNLINRLIHPHGHPTFTHFEATNGSESKLVGAGIIEATWYIPGQGTTKNVFEKPTLILNLRGDGLQHEQEVAYLKSITNLLIIMTNTRSLVAAIENKLFENYPTIKGLLFLLEFDKKEDPSNIISSFKDHQVKMEKRSSSNIKMSKLSPGSMTSDSISLLQTTLGDMLKDKPCQLLSELLTENIFKEKVSPFTDGAFSKLWSLLEGQPIAKIKSLQTPVTLKDWKSYTAEERQRLQSRIPNTDSDSDSGDESDGESEKLDTERTADKTSSADISVFMDTFITLLTSYADKGDISILTDVLRKLEINLSQMSQSTIAPMRAETIDLNRSRKDAKLKGDQQAAIQRQISEISKSVSESSIGLEHFMREMALIYSFTKELGSFGREKEKLRHLPRVAARLLMKGYPLEILDGEVSNIPHFWVNSLFEEIVKLIGDKKVFILSILGVQSSGKSTFLNTLFGSNFTVSAARCTRGIFMQMVPVDRSSQEIPFDFILVLDTEGLRAPERMDEDVNVRIDNELATFVIALSDVTLINAKGENSAELRNVIQIVLYAFIRMNIVAKTFSLSRRCIFIHQNTPAVNAQQLNISSCTQMEKSLNDMTKIAAKRENMTQFTRFDQIIQFDGIDDMWYFPDRTSGSASMSHVNPAYCEKANEFRQYLFSSVKDGNKQFLPLSEVGKRINDIWISILRDNFVLSFKSFLEIRAYSRLEELYRLINQTIAEGIREIECQSHAAFRLQPDDLDACQGDIEQSICKRHKEIAATIIDQVESFRAENDCYIGLMSQYTDSRKDALLDELKNRVDTLKTSIHIMRQIHENRKSIDKATKAQRQRLIQLAVEKASDSKEVNEDKLRAVFEHYWSTWENNMPLVKLSSFNQTDIWKHIGDALNSSFSDRKNIVAEEMRSLTKLHREGKTNDEPGRRITINTSDMSHDNLGIEQNGNPYDPDEEVMMKCKEAAETHFHSGIVPHVLGLIDEIQKNDVYNQAIVPYILAETIKKSEASKISVTESIFVKFREAYIVRLSARVLARCFEKIWTYHSEFMHKHNPEVKLEEFKNTLWVLFQGKATSVKAEIFVAKTLAATFKPALERAAVANYPQTIKDIALKDMPTKASLIKSIMLSLIEKFRNNDFKEYRSNPQQYAWGWWQKKVIRERMLDILEISMTKALRGLTDVLDRIYSQFVNGERVDKWITIFVNDTHNPLLDNDIKGVEDFKDEMRDAIISDKEHFKMILKNCIEKTATGIRETLKRMSVDELAKSSNLPWFQRAIDEIWGCTELCPFCREPCRHGIPNHPETQHSCFQHRPIFLFSEKKLVKRVSFNDCSHNITRREAKFMLKKRYHKFCNYQRYHRDWQILENQKPISSPFWQYLLCTYRQKLDKSYGLKPDIPLTWTSVNEKDARESVESCYKP